MAACYFPLQYLIAALALWLDRQQQAAIDYLKEENRLLKRRPKESWVFRTFCDAGRG